MSCVNEAPELYPFLSTFCLNLERKKDDNSGVITKKFSSEKRTFRYENKGNISKLFFNF